MMVRGNARLLFLAFPDRLLADYELCSIRYSFSGCICYKSQKIICTRLRWCPLREINYRSVI